MGRPRSEDERKQQIRAAAARCFVRQGYAATRLLDIAREAGLSKGGVYFHYKAKEELFHEILADLSAELRRRWVLETEGSSTLEQPADRTLGALVKAHLRTMEEDGDELRLVNLLVTMASRDPLFRAKLEEITHIMRELYARVIARGIGEGVFAPGDPNTLAISVLAYVNGLGSFIVLDGEGRLPVVPEAAAQHVLHMLRPPIPASRVEFGPTSSTSN